MNRFLKWHYILLLCLSCLWISPIHATSPTASTLLAQSNLNLQSDIISLRARISRLEQEVNRLRSSAISPSPQSIKPKQPTPNPAPRSTIINPPVVDGRAIGNSDPLYERLATLLIELKEDVRDLDRRLTEIEQVNP